MTDLSPIRPQLSVVIPAYDVVPYVAAAIRSALDQRGVFLEAIVVDDGSTDGTRAVLERFRGDPRVRLVFQENAGPSAARNSALWAAEAPYVGFLDADDLWRPEKALKHLTLMEQRPEFDVTYSWWRTIDEEGRDTGRRTTVPAERVPGGLGLAGLVIENFTGTASTLVCRRDALLAVGGFDPGLRSNVDLDLLLRLAARRPNNIGLVPEILTAYRMRGGQITRDWTRMRRNWEIVVARAAKANPGLVAAVRPKALARQTRYHAYLAYEAGDLGAARRLLREAWAAHPRVLLGDRRAWLTTAAILASLLPGRAHQALARAVKARRARHARRVDA